MRSSDRAIASLRISPRQFNLGEPAPGPCEVRIFPDEALVESRSGLQMSRLLGLESVGEPLDQLAWRLVTHLHGRGIKGNTTSFAAQWHLRYSRLQ